MSKDEKGSCITINCGCCGNSNGTTNDSTPVGTIISYMGTSAPKHYLMCDGTTTFAVPDLRNDFLTTPTA